MSRDIVDTSASPDWLAVATRIESEPADQLARLGVEDADVTIGDEQPDQPSLVSAAEADVVQPAGVAQGDRAAGVDSVLANSEVGVG